MAGIVPVATKLMVALELGLCSGSPFFERALHQSINFSQGQKGANFTLTRHGSFISTLAILLGDLRQR